MAKIVFPGGFPEMSGKLQGWVISKNKYGYYIKEYKKPRNPQTIKQQEVRSRMGILTRLWRELSIEQLEGWQEGVKRFNIRNKKKKGLLSGFGFFVKTNMNLMNIDCKPITDCPAWLEIPMMLNSVNMEIIHTKKEENIIMSYMPNMDRSNVIVVSASAPQIGHCRPSERKYRKIGILDWRWNPGFVGVSLQKMYMDKFGQGINPHSTAGFKFQVVEKVTGQATRPIFVVTSI